MVPTWCVSGSADHPWVLTLPDDQNWAASVTAERLEVTADGTLVFYDSGVVALVIQPHHYSYVKWLGWEGLVGDV
jgi:hypothetical protein